LNYCKLLYTFCRKVFRIKKGVFVNLDYFQRSSGEINSSLQNWPLIIFLWD
jgi:hypothetical protein